VALLDRIQSYFSIISTLNNASAKVQIDYRLRDAQSIVSYSRFIEMCAWAYGTIYDWRPEIDLLLK
jgi:hypothetical protein